MSARKILKTGSGNREISTSFDAKPGDFSNIPVINLRNPEGVVIEKLRNACTRVGFFYLSGHGIPEFIVEGGFSQAKSFFNLDLDEKLKIDNAKSPAFVGYTKLLAENSDHNAGEGDVHEAFDCQIGEELTSGATDNHNQWPDGVPDFRREGEIDEKRLGCGSHTDFTCFTLLSQDDVQALQIINKDGDWAHATPKKNHFVVNIGDMLQRWSNNTFLSTVHRAINRSGKDRQSILLFAGVDADTMIEGLPSCVSETNPPLYEPVKAGGSVQEHMVKFYSRAPGIAQVAGTKGI